MDAECCGVLDGAADMLLEINAKENGVASFACGYMDERVSFHIRGVPNTNQTATTDNSHYGPFGFASKVTGLALLCASVSLWLRDFSAKPTTETQRYREISSQATFRARLVHSN
jgi:hypothetical protein